mmetsp:Transcript_2008/g.4508  ORF Transcript_2008/g.4508 Transcript_2008/m.4508 type:complete len:87 (-) Transcript_2008:618-878(-)
MQGLGAGEGADDPLMGAGVIYGWPPWAGGLGGKAALSCDTIRAALDALLDEQVSSCVLQSSCLLKVFCFQPQPFLHRLQDQMWRMH